MKRRLSPEEESDRLLSWHNALPRCLETVNQQLQVLQTRSQLLLTLSTLTLTITGFSGAKIAATNTVARATMASGLVIVMLATILVLIGALQINWITQIDEQSDRDTLIAILRYRNRKTTMYRWQLGLLVVGLTCYVASVVTYMTCGQ